MNEPERPTQPPEPTDWLTESQIERRRIEIRRRVQREMRDTDAWYGLLDGLISDDSQIDIRLLARALCNAYVGHDDDARELLARVADDIVYRLCDACANEEELT
jgi:hypothetical protein